MSDIEPKGWTWNISNIHNMTVLEIRSLLESRESSILNGKKIELLKHLKTNYEIDDDNIKPLKHLSVKQLQNELILRHLSPKNASKEDLIERLSINRIPSSDKLLVYGYIRENELLLKYGQFIPFYLRELIVNFCETSIISYYLTNKYPNYIFIANINNGDNEKWRAKIIELNSNNIGNTGNIDIKLENASICSIITKSLVLPLKIQELIRKHNKYNTDRFHMIFKAGNNNRKCWVLLLNDNEMMNNMNNMDKEYEMNAFRWNLPTRHHEEGCICFDEEYGLLSIVGHYFSSLSFGCNSYLTQNGWNWEKKRSLIGGYWRDYPSSIIIKTDDKEKRLFVVGGHRWEHKTDIYCFKKDEWVKTKEIIKPISKAGICYNNLTQKIYVGGGESLIYRDFNALSRVQSFDLFKQQWFKLPPTICEHINYPILWNNDKNNNLLFIGSVFQNSLEFIDLRMSENKKWNLLCIPNHTHALSNKFGVKFSNSSYSRLCITQI